MTTLWVRGLLRRRPARLIGTAVGIAVAVALLASLGAFLAHSKATMTDRAVRGVGVDWQVQVQPGADPAAVTATVAVDPGRGRRCLPVDFATDSRPGGHHRRHPTVHRRRHRPRPARRLPRAVPRPRSAP